MRSQRGKKTRRSNAWSPAAFPILSLPGPEKPTYIEGPVLSHRPLCMRGTDFLEATGCCAAVFHWSDPSLSSLLPDDGRNEGGRHSANQPQRAGCPHGHASQVLCFLGAWIVHQSPFEFAANIEPWPYYVMAIKFGSPASPPGLLPMSSRLELHVSGPTWQCRQLGSSPTGDFPGCSRSRFTELAGQSVCSLGPFFFSLRIMFLSIFGRALVCYRYLLET